MIDPQTYDPKADFHGTKGLIVVDDKLILIRRDSTTDLFPQKIDVPGGGREEGESAFDTFQREVKEELNLKITRQDITYSRLYPSAQFEGKFAYFMVANLPPGELDNMKLGEEGEEIVILSPKEYVERKDAWPIFQERAGHFFESQGVKL